MRVLYEKMLRLYPAEFRQDFAEEMAWCYAQAAAERAGLRRTRFALRELTGLFYGACEEHLRSAPGVWKLLRRVIMISRNKRFRFPIAAIALMTVSFGMLVYAIRLARAISYTYAASSQMFKGAAYEPDHVSIMQTFGFAFGVTVVLTVVVLAILHVTGRAGVQRLADAETWPHQ